MDYKKMKEAFTSFFNTQRQNACLHPLTWDPGLEELGYSSTSFHCHKTDGPPIDVWFKRVSKRDPTDNITKLVKKEMSEVHEFTFLYQNGGPNRPITYCLNKQGKDIDDATLLSFICYRQQ